MKEENFNGEREAFVTFIRMIHSGKLKAGSIKPIYDAFTPGAPANKSLHLTARQLGSQEDLFHHVEGFMRAAGEILCCESSVLCFVQSGSKGLPVFNTP
jgi:hypothetical protein